MSKAQWKRRSHSANIHNIMFDGDYLSTICLVSSMEMADKITELLNAEQGTPLSCKGCRNNESTVCYTCIRNATTDQFDNGKNLV